MTVRPSFAGSLAGGSPAVQDGAGGAVLQLERLTVGYRQRGRARVVLAEVTASVAAGELVCLVGPNGAGKSTLLRTVVRLQPALSGAVSLSGHPIGDMSRRQFARKVAVVLTERVEPGRLRARDLVALGRHPHTAWTGRLDESDHAAVDSAMARGGVAALAEQELAELSDGQRQRVMVARALAQQPEVLILDEPTAFLDPPGRLSLLGLLADTAHAEQVAVLVSTHDLELSARVADTIWVASMDGHVESGGPEDLVLSGQLTAPFLDEATVFDADTLRFTTAPRVAPTAVVDGHGPAAVLAAHALRRAGYRVVTAGERPDIWVSIRVGGTGPPDRVESCLRHGASATHHPNLDALARYASQLRCRPIQEDIA